MAIIDHLTLGLRKRASASVTSATFETSATSAVPNPETGPTEDGISRLAEAVGPVVIVGGGPSGLRVAEELARRDIPVTLLNAERWQPYNRVKLTPFLAGEVQIGHVYQPAAFILAAMVYGGDRGFLLTGEGSQ